MDERPLLRDHGRVATAAPDSAARLTPVVAAPARLDLGRVAVWASRIFALLIILYLSYQGTKWLGTFAFGLAFIGVALDVYLTFRILRFPDLTIDGSFPLGACFYAAAVAVWGWPPLLATAGGLLAGAAAGLCTGLLHTRLKIDGLLASIIVMISLYTVNLRLMGQAQTALTDDNQQLMTPLVQAATQLFGTTNARGVRALDGSAKALLTLLFFAFVALLLILIVNWFLHTELGLALRATGDNEYMIRALGVNTDTAKILVLALANGLAGLCGALIASYQNFADVSMGRGMIVVGLAALIMGEALVAPRSILWALVGAAVGGIAYRVIYTATISFEVTQALLVRWALYGALTALVAFGVWWLYRWAGTRGASVAVVAVGVALGAAVVVGIGGLGYAVVTDSTMERASVFKLQVDDIELALGVLIVVALAVPNLRKTIGARMLGGPKKQAEDTLTPVPSPAATGEGQEMV